MSTFIMKPEDLRQIADFLYELNEFGFNRFGFPCPDKLIRYINMYHYHDNKMKVIHVYNVLLALNIAGYNHAYIDKKVNLTSSEYDMPEEKDGYKSIISLRVADSNGEHIQPWHYKMAGLLDTYLYQVEDCTLYVTAQLRDMFYALKELKNILNEFIVSNYRDPMELGTMGCRSIPGTDIIVKSKDYDDLKYWADTNEDNGTITVPKYICDSIFNNAKRVKDVCANDNGPTVDMTVENILCKLCDESNVVIQNSSYKELARYDGRDSIDTKFNTKNVLSMHVEMIEQLHRPGSFVPALVIEVEED